MRSTKALSWSFAKRCAACSSLAAAVAVAAAAVAISYSQAIGACDGQAYRQIADARSTLIVRGSFRSYVRRGQGADVLIHSTAQRSVDDRKSSMLLACFFEGGSLRG